MASYTVPVTFKFKGEFYIEADTAEQAMVYAERHCGLIIGGDIHSSLPDDIVDWDFPVHPEKKVGRARKVSEDK